MEGNDGEELLWKFKSIDAHQGPLKQMDAAYKGSRWNVRVNWENGEVTYEPLAIIAKSNPVTCAIYADKNNLLELEGWRQFKKIAKRQKKFLRMVKQAVLQSYRTCAIYKFGIEVPRNHQEAMDLDAKNGNKLWREAEL